MPDRRTVDEPSQSASQILGLMRLLWRSKYILLIGMFLGCAIGAVAAWLTPPAYRATVVMMPNAETGVTDGLGSALGQAGGLAALVGLGGSGNRLDEAIAILESRKFTESLIVDYQLLPRLFPKAWDSAGRSWRVPASEQPTVVDGFKRFDKLRRVRRDSKTGVVTLELIWPDAAEAADLANSMVARLNDTMRERDMAEATRSVDLLNVELNRTEVVAIQSSIQKLIEANIRRRTLANTRQDYVLRVIDPAIAVEPGHYFRPRPVLYVAAGGFSGLLLGVVFVALMHFGRLLRRTQAAEGVA